LSYTSPRIQKTAPADDVDVKNGLNILHRHANFATGDANKSDVLYKTGHPLARNATLAFSFSPRM
jgi:hypothetical protein